MILTYPESLDPFNLPRNREAKNAAEHSSALQPGELVYCVHELEKKVGTDNSRDPASLDYQVAALHQLISGLAARVAAVEAAVSGLTDQLQWGMFRSRATVVETGGTAVRFSIPMAAGYIILGACYNAADELTGFTLSDQSSEGFTVVPHENGVFEWMAIPAR